MSGDFNQPGQKYNYYRVNPLRLDYGVLPEESHELFKTIYNTIRQKWNSVGGEEWKHLTAINDCLSQLMSFFLQVSRIAKHAEEIQNILVPEDIEHLILTSRAISDRLTLLVTSDTGQVMAISAQEACIDFESLLLHSKATLDRLTYFIPSETEPKYRDRYEHIEKVLDSVTAPSFHLAAKLALDVVKEATPYLKGLVQHDDNREISSEEKQSLRSHLIQQSSVYENTSQVFVIHRLENKKILRFDCILHGYPILKSTQELSTVIPYVVLNILSFFLLEKVQPLPCINFEPLWQNPTVAYDEFLDETNSGPRFTIFQDNPGGFHLRTRHLSEAVLNHAEKEPDRTLATGRQHSQRTVELVRGVVNKGGNDNLQSDEVKGILFEEIVYNLLTLIYPQTSILPNKILGEKREKYEYDFIIHNQHQKEIIIVEAKGYKEPKRINLGNRDTKETVQWFFRRTFPFAKRHVDNPYRYAIKACYMTWANFSDDAMEFLEKLNESRLRSANLEVFYNNRKLRNLLKKHGLDNKIKKLEKCYSK